MRDLGKFAGLGLKMGDGMVLEHVMRPEFASFFRWREERI